MPTLTLADRLLAVMVCPDRSRGDHFHQHTPRGWLCLLPETVKSS